MLGWHWGGVMVGHVHCNGVEVTVDLHVAKSEEAATTGLQVARWRWQQGLASLRRHGVRDHVVERGGSLRTQHVGERLLKDSATLVRNEMKKNISRPCAYKWCCRKWWQWVWWLREGGGNMVACMPMDGVVIIPLVSAMGVVPMQWWQVW